MPHGSPPSGLGGEGPLQPWEVENAVDEWSFGQVGMPTCPLAGGQEDTGCALQDSGCAAVCAVPWCRAWGPLWGAFEGLWHPSAVLQLLLGWGAAQVSSAQQRMGIHCLWAEAFSPYTQNLSSLLPLVQGLCQPGSWWPQGCALHPQAVLSLIPLWMYSSSSSPDLSHFILSTCTPGPHSGFWWLSLQFLHSFAVIGKGSSWRGWSHKL